ncbi:MAG: TapY2 family type IVa secretion system protein [Colwellia sp.]
MKYILILINVVIIAAISFSSFANKNRDVKEKKVDAKCYIQLVGGEEAISLWLVEPSKLKKLSQTIVGQNVLIPSKKNKSTIYKVIECVLAADEFSSKRAKKMDEELPR